MIPVEFPLDTATRFAAAFSRSTGIGCTVLDRQGRIRYPSMEEYSCSLCRLASGETPDELSSSNRHWRWVEQAMRFGGRYIFLCDNAFTHWTSPILSEGRLVGALVAGPVLTIEDADFFDTQLVSPDSTADEREGLRRLFSRVPRVEPSRVTALSELLYAVARVISDSSGEGLEEGRTDLDRQSRMNEYIQELKGREELEAANQRPYPMEKERELLDQIRLGSVGRAQKTLNEILGHVFFASGSDIESIRYRTHELVALLSRAVINEGADPEEVFGLNFHFVEALDQQTDVNGVAFWMARIARRFADLVLYMPNVPHGSVMRKAARYVRAHLSEQIRIADVAGHVGLSSTYFSRIFAREMGARFVTYVTRARIERARELLRTTNEPVTSIAAEVGIGDHSYFTKLFKAETGVTPSVYRAGGS